MDNKLKNELYLALRFLVLFSIVVIALHFLTQTFLLQFELLYAHTLQLLLQFFNVQGTLIVKEPVWLVLNELTIQISYLCTGLLELSVLLAAIVATEKIAFKKRAIGMLIALPVAFVFNTARIFFTALLLLNTETFGIADLAHDFFFRASLFVLIAGFYFLWLKWAIKKGEH